MKDTMKLPADLQGYAVNPSTGTIHTRYADHGNGAKTRTAKGVESILDGKAGRPCGTCYPSSDTPHPEDNEDRPPA